MQLAFYMLFHRLKISAILIMIGGLVSCSNPKQSPRTIYPGNEAISSPQGVPRDSATSYFPFEAGENPNKIIPRDTLEAVPYERTLDCQADLQFTSQCLFAFKAPVLSNYFLGQSTYRFIWLRSFHPPVLLTLRCTSDGRGKLQTQFLNKSPGMSIPTITNPDELGISPKEHQRRTVFKGKTLLDTAYLASIAFAKAPVVIQKDSTTELTENQVQQFRQLLVETAFWKMPGCKPSLMLDGAYWLLEAQEPKRYCVVNRQSPDVNRDYPFRRCCDFLLDLSPTKPEERY